MHHNAFFFAGLFHLGGLSHVLLLVRGKQTSVSAFFLDLAQAIISWLILTVSQVAEIVLHLRVSFRRFGLTDTVLGLQLAHETLRSFLLLFRTSLQKERWTIVSVGPLFLEGVHEGVLQRLLKDSHGIESTGSSSLERCGFISLPLDLSILSLQLVSLLLLISTLV